MSRVLFTALVVGSVVCNVASAKTNRLSEKQIEDTIVRAANVVGVPSHLVLAICWIESNYRHSLPEHPDGETPSYGICQVKLETAKHMDDVYKHKYPVTIERLRDPFVNAFYASKYIHFQLKRYGGNWKAAVIAYNQGTWYGRETTPYLNKVKKAIVDRQLAVAE